MSTICKNQVTLYTATDADENQRLDNFLVKLLKGVPKTHIYRIIRNGEVRVNKKRANVSDKLAIGDQVRIPPIRIASVGDPEKKPLPPKTGFPILFEDDHLLIINKPSGIACHGGSGISFGVIEQLRHNSQPLKFLELVHRLDRETSGVLILAKKRASLVAIQNLLRNGEVNKHYLALVSGLWTEKTREIKLPLYKYVTIDGDRRVRVDHELGQFAHTIFRPVEHFDEFSLVDANLKTGRTHQIRVHLQYLNLPIAGDSRYGNFDLNKKLAKFGLKRMFLHAHSIKFVHPVTQEKVLINAPLPEDLQAFLAKLRIPKDDKCDR